MGEEMMLLKDRVAIVTGAARGIGKGIAVEFARHGASIVAVDILGPDAEHVASLCRQIAGCALGVECDITDSAQVETAVRRTLARYGKVDILVNNAGGDPASMPAAELPDDRWDEVLALNLKGAFLCCKSLTPHMKRRGYGKIVNISSLGALHSPHPSVAYHSAKLGVVGMTLDLASELAPHNIHVNVILPGAIRTETLDSFIQSQDKEQFYSGIAGEIPLGRVGTPEDVGRVAVFLASELSDYLTGCILPVAGGQPYVGVQRVGMGFSTGR
jgi:3-oxoacyl-[acyl-carrier protein] reductase